MSNELVDRAGYVALSVFLGQLGVDSFALGCVGTGFAKLFTFGGFGVWWLLDVVRLATGNKLCQSTRFIGIDGGAGPFGMDDPAVNALAVVVGILFVLAITYVVMDRRRRTKDQC